MSAEGQVTRRKKADWEAVHRDYRADRLTLAQIADKHGINADYLCRVAKRKGWQKDLREAIGQATSAAIIRDVVAERTASDVETVLAAAEVNRAVVASHRGALSKVRRLADKLLDEAELTTDALAILEPEEAAAVLLGLGVTQEQVKALLKATALPRRLEAMASVAQALSKLVPLERATYGIGEERPQDSFEDWLARHLGKAE